MICRTVPHWPSGTVLDANLPRPRGMAIVWRRRKVEIGPSEAADAAVRSTAGLKGEPTLRELAGIPRVLQACRPRFPSRDLLP